MRRLLPALLALALVAPATHAASTPFLAVIQSTDSDAGATLLAFHAPLVFTDLNGNQKPDVSAPDEPVYIDMDNSQTVSYGDIRLTPLDGLAAGAPVGVADVDMGRNVQKLAGGYGHVSSTWFVDTDANGKVSEGDVNLADLVKVPSGDALLGSTLAMAPSTDLARRAGSSLLYLDLDTVQGAEMRVTSGDLRVTPQEPATTPAAATSAGSTVNLFQTNDAGFRMLDGILVILAVLNLAGLLFVVRTVNQLRGPPKNPFK